MEVMQWGNESEGDLSEQVDEAMHSDSESDSDREVPWQWEAAQAPRELNQDLLPIRNYRRAGPPSQVSECTPALLLPHALRKDHPELNFTPTSARRRIRGKGMPDAYIGVILARLQSDSTAPLDPWKATWQKRRLAYHE